MSEEATRKTHRSGLCRSAISFALLALTGTVYAQNAVVYVPTITTIAGTGTAGNTGDGGLASAALFGNACYVMTDAAGNIYMMDKTKMTIRMIAPETAGGPLYISHFAGSTTGTAGYTGDGGPAASATLNAENSAWVTPNGDVYIADTTNNAVRVVYEGGANAAAVIKLTNSITAPVVGDIYTIAGTGTAGFAGDGSVSNNTTTKVNGPNGIAVDGSGDVFIGDSGNQRIREIAITTGIINTIAGNGSGTAAGDGGLASASQISGPRNLYFDWAGNLFVTDRTYCTVREITGLSNPATAVINLVAGTHTSPACSYAGDGTAAIGANLDSNNSTAVDAQDNLYMAETSGNVLRAVNSASGIIYTIAGKGPSSASSTGDGGLSTSATLDGPLGIGIMPNGNLLIDDSAAYKLRMLALANSFPTTSVGGTSAAQTNAIEAIKAATINSFGMHSGSPADFSFGAITGCTLPAALTADSVCSAPISFTPTAPGLRTGQLEAIDSGSNKYFLGLTGVGNSPAVAVSPGTITAFAGTGVAGSTGDGGAATAALVTAPAAVALDSAGNVYLAGSDNKVRMVSGGSITTIAGTGTAGYSGDGGAATAAKLSNPTGLAISASGNVYIADTANNVVRAINANNGNITTVPGTAGVFSAPSGIAVDTSGNLYVADTGNNVIRKVNVYTANVSIVAGTGTAGFSGDTGAATAATLRAPAGVTLDAAGNIYIADTGNNVIRKITAATGIITTVAGNATAGSSGNGGAATSAELSGPKRVVVDAAGDLYIADTGNNEIRFVSAASGSISTLAGVLGTPSLATLDAPGGIALDQFADLYIADTANNRIASVNEVTTTLAFGNVNPGTTTAAQTAMVTNFGNQTLTLTGLSVPAGFAQGTSSSGTNCTATSNLAPGASCVIQVTFTPTGSGSYNNPITITDNALNGTATTQAIQLTGVGNATAPPAAVKATTGNNQAAPPYTAFATVLQATVVDANNFGVTGVQVVFTAPSSGATGTFANGTDTTTVTTAAGGVATATVFTSGATRGQFTITATAAGVTTPASFTETIAGNTIPAVAVTYTPATTPITYGQTVTLHATLTPTSIGGNTVTGTVAFYDNGGTTAIGSGTVSSGATSIPYTPPAGNNSFSATYSGDTNFGTSSGTDSTALVVNALGITAAATATPASIVYGTTTVPVLTGTLSGVLPADSANVTPTFSTTATTSSTPGVYPITTTLSGSAAGNYTVTSTSGTVTVLGEPTVGTLTSTTNNVGVGSSVILVDNVATLPPNSVNVAGASVSFYDGSTLLGVRSAGTGGNATLTTTTLALGTHIITAVYNGAGIYAGDTSNSYTITIVTPSFTFNMLSSPATITVAQGQQGQLQFSYTTAGGYSTPITASCSGMPANSTCTFTPVTFTPTTTTPTQKGIMVVNTAGPLNAGNRPAPLRNSRTAPLLALCFGCSLFCLRRKGGIKLIALLVALTAGALSLNGCGSGVATPLAGVYTPVGTTSLNITITSGTTVINSPFTLTVTPGQ